MSKTYKTGEACRELDVQPYVLRYWETEFPMVQGRKSGSQREYSAEEIEILRRIKELLYDEGYTIAGAKKRLEAEASEGPKGGGAKPSGPTGAKRTPVGKAAAQADGETARPEDAGDRGAAASGSGADGEEASVAVAATTETSATPSSLDSGDSQSIETVLPELRRLHREAREILALVRDTP